MGKKIVKKKLRKNSGGFFSRLFGKDSKEKIEGKKKFVKKKVLKKIKNEAIKDSEIQDKKKLELKVFREENKLNFQGVKEEENFRKIDKIKYGKLSKKKQIQQNLLKKREKQKFKKGKFFQTGINGFDILFEKGMGIPSGASVLIEGGPGSGKTLFSLTTLNQLCLAGKKCLYMSFEESETSLIEHMKKFNFDPEGFIEKGLLRVTRFDAIDVSRSIEALLSAAKKELMIEVDPVFFPEDFDPDFIVIDSLTSIASAFSGEDSRFRIYMEQLFRYLEKNNITNFLIREVSSPSHIGAIYQEKGEAVSFLSDGIIVIYNVIYDSGKRGSAIEILKMRGAKFEKKIVELKIINKKGVKVYPDKVLTRKKGFSLT